MHRSAIVVATLVLLASCAREEERKPSAPRNPVPSSAPPSGQLVTAEVPPDLIEKMRADLGQHAGIAASAAEVVRAESIVWPNAALGCPQPGQTYAQALVPGYVVEFEHDGRTYSYHASKEGGFTRC
jgi:hypothetical protein